MRISILILTFFLSLLSRASTPVYFKHPNLSANDFAASMLIAKAKNSGALTYSEYFLENAESKKWRERITEAFIIAQRSFLQANDLHSISNWESVIDFSYKTNWSKSSRSLISIAYFRLAQMAEEAEKSEDYLRQALAFDEDFSPDPKMFPPPLLAKFAKLKMLTAKAQILSPQFARFEYLIINGKVYSLSNDRTIFVAPGIKYITLVSSSFKSISKVIHSEDIVQYQPEHDAFIAHPCEARIEELNAKLYQPLYKAEVFYPKSCGISGKTTLSVASAPASEYKFEDPSIEQRVNTRPEKAFYQKPRFWIGAAVLSAVVIMYNSKEEKEEYKPTRREGF